MVKTEPTVETVDSQKDMFLRTQPNELPKDSSQGVKTITIGDLHGRNKWRKCADLSILVDYPNLKTDFDKYIFVGDYTDEYYIPDDVIFDNLKDIIQLKKNYPDNIILLWGNHELQYLLGPKYLCSGFRESMHFKLHNLLVQNRKLFQTAYQIKNYLWTHAGVEERWYSNRFMKVIHDDNANLAEKLNQAFDRNVDSMFDVGYIREGNVEIGGPFWLDRRNFKNGVESLNQIVGHTAVNNIYTIFFEEQKGSVTFTDCLQKQTSFYRKEIY